VETIAAAFRRLEAVPADEAGLVLLEFRGLRDHEAVSLFRAVLRAEARILREEADRMTGPAQALLSPDDRTCRALALLLLRLAEVRQREAKAGAA
jgi:hypothetical protein